VWVLANTTIDVNSKDGVGDTPIYITLFNRHLMASNLLIERGANLFAMNNNGVRAIDSDNGPRVLQHAKTLLWKSVKPLLLLSKSNTIAAADDSLPSHVLLSVEKSFGIVRRIASFLKRGGLIVKELQRPVHRSRGSGT
jgi:hypothetical protein